MDYPDYLRTQAAEFRARAQEIDQAALAREFHELAQVCEHVAEELEDRQTAVAERLGFGIQDHSLILYGHCQRPNCAYRKRKAS